MRKLYFLAFVLLMMPFGVKAIEANYQIDGLYINADVESNGDMLVQEQIVDTGSFNGYERDLSYKGNYSLYDASDLQLQKVCELSPYRKGSFDIEDSDLSCFTENDYAVKGDTHEYIRTDNDSTISLKMFDYNESGTKIFYVEYLLKNVVVIHDDVAELYWTFIGKNFADDITNVKITINLPGKANDLRAWAHGPLNGDIKLDNGNKIVATISNLYANNLVDIRSTFDKSIVLDGSKLSHDTALPTILKEEQQRADEANRQRNLDKILVYGMDVLSFIWIIGAILLATYTYRKYDKERKSDFNQPYYRDFPAEYGPEIVEYLMKHTNTSLSLSAMILNIIYKKGLTIREDKNSRGKSKYVLVKQSTTDNQLTANETYVVDWLINDVGNGSEVSLDEIKHSSSTDGLAEAFIKKYDKWHELVKTDAINEKFYEDYTNFKIKGSLYACLGIAIFVISIALSVINLLTVSLLFASIILLVYIISFLRRTVKGNDHYVKWKAFKHFLLDFGRFGDKELPEIALWDKYLVYATVLGVANKVAKTMAIKAKEMGVNDTMAMYPNFYMNYYFASNLVSTVNTVRTASMSQIAKSNSASGGGFGGGFSGGGGFGGGGVGGGGSGF